ncbi:MAG: hypothetical protein AAB966_01560, partial [Patescibacteria group bacterium]
TVGVWVGNNDNSPMNPKIASVNTGASHIWYNIMSKLLGKDYEYKDGIIQLPSKIKALTVDSYLGGLPKDGSPTRSEYFVEGSEPKDVSPAYKKLKISKSTGKLANDVEIKSGDYEEKEFVVVRETDPVSTDGKNRWQEAIDAWAKGQGDGKFHYPTETSDANVDSVAVSIKNPSDKSTVGNSFHVEASIVSGDKIKNIKIFIDGKEERNLDGHRQTIDESFNLSDGVYEIKVVAKNEKDKEGSSTIKIGVNKAP